MQKTLVTWLVQGVFGGYRNVLDLKDSNHATQPYEYIKNTEANLILCVLY